MPNKSRPWPPDVGVVIWQAASSMMNARGRCFILGNIAGLRQEGVDYVGHTDARGCTCQRIGRGQGRGLCGPHCDTYAGPPEHFNGRVKPGFRSPRTFGGLIKRDP